MNSNSITKLLQILVIVSSMIADVYSYKLIECSTSMSNVDIWVSSYFNPKQTELIQKAVNEWGKYGAMVQIVGYGYQPTQSGDEITTISPSDDTFLADAKIGGVYSADGKWYFKDVDIRINTNRLTSDNSFYSSVLHEIGHAIGLGHSEYKNSTMGRSLTMTYDYEIVDQPVWVITDDDVEGLKQTNTYSLEQHMSNINESIDSYQNLYQYNYNPNQQNQYQYNNLYGYQYNYDYNRLNEYNNYKNMYNVNPFQRNYYYNMYRYNQYPFISEHVPTQQPYRVNYNPQYEDGNLLTLDYDIVLKDNDDSTIDMPIDIVYP